MTVALLLAYVNTLDVESGTDGVATADELASWLGERGLLAIGRRVTQADLALAIEVRESARRLLRAHDGELLDGDTVHHLNEVLGRLPVRVRIAAGGEPELGPGEETVAGALAELVAGAMVDADWERLKICALDSCQWAFVDESRNRSRRWCSMEVCGNRAKTRDYRARHGG